MYLGACNIDKAFLGTCELSSVYLGVCEVLGGAVEPVFWVNGYDPVTFEMLGVKTGVGGLTEARAYQIEVPDYQGVYVSVPGGQPAWDGARWDGGVAYADNGSGVLLDPVPRLVYAPQATNQVLQSNDLTAGWTLHGGTRSMDQVGLRGDANGATLISDTSSTANNQVRLTRDTGSTIGSMSVIYRLRKDPSAMTTAGLKLAFESYAGDRIIYGLDLVTGDTSLLLQSNLTAEISVVSDGDWWKVCITASHSSAVFFLEVYGALGYNLSAIDATAIGACTVGNVEVYIGMSHQEALTALPIFTMGAAVTRDACAQSYDTANHDDTEGTYLIEIEHGADGQMLLSEFLRIIGVSMRLTDGVNLADVASAAGSHKVGITYGGGSMQLTVDGVKSGAQSYDGTLLVGALDLFRGSPNVGYAGSIRRYDASDESIVDAWMVE